MTTDNKATDRRVMYANGLRQSIGPEDADIRARHEAAVRDEYDACDDHDTFESLKLRAQFSKEDQGFLRDWLRTAEARVKAFERS